MSRQIEAAAFVEALQIEMAGPWSRRSRAKLEARAAAWTSSGEPLCLRVAVLAEAEHMHPTTIEAIERALATAAQSVPMGQLAMF